METETFAFIGAIVFSLGYFVYLIEMLRGNCEPTRASWLVWASVNLLALLAMAYEGKANPLAWLVGIISPIIFLLSLYFGKPGWSLIDKVCATLAFVGLLLWFVVTAEYTILTIIVIFNFDIVQTNIPSLAAPS